MRHWIHVQLLWLPSSDWRAAWSSKKSCMCSRIQGCMLRQSRYRVAAGWQKNKVGYFLIRVVYWNLEKAWRTILTKSLRIFDQPSITHSQLILNNLSNYSFKTSSLNKELVGVLLSIRRFIRENSDVISIRADKSNVTVALNKEKYLEKNKRLSQG